MGLTTHPILFSEEGEKVNYFAKDLTLCALRKHVPLSEQVLRLHIHDGAIGKMILLPHVLPYHIINNRSVPADSICSSILLIKA